MGNDVMELIKSEIQNNKIVLFMKGTPDAPQCGFSAATVEVLRGFKRPFKGINILANPEIREMLPEYSNWPTFPQLFIDGKLLGGCDIVHELKESGELEKILNAAFKS